MHSMIDNDQTHHTFYLFKYEWRWFYKC